MDTQMGYYTVTCLCTTCVLLNKHPILVLLLLALVTITCITVLVNIIGNCIRRERKIKALFIRRRRRAAS